MMPGILHRGTCGGECLHDHLPLGLPSPCPTGDLRQQLEGSLTGAEVGSVQADVRIDDANKSHIGKIEPLGNHLGADENIDLAGAEFPEHLAIRSLPAHRVGIHSRDAGRRKKLPDRFLDPLRSDS